MDPGHAQQVPARGLAPRHVAAREPEGPADGGRQAGAKELEQKRAGLDPVLRQGRRGERQAGDGKRRGMPDVGPGRRPGGGFRQQVPRVPPQFEALHLRQGGRKGRGEQPFHGNHPGDEPQEGVPAVRRNPDLQGRMPLDGREGARVRGAPPVPRGGGRPKGLGQGQPQAQDLGVAFPGGHVPDGQGPVHPRQVEEFGMVGHVAAAAEPEGLVREGIAGPGLRQGLQVVLVVLQGAGQALPHGLPAHLRGGTGAARVLALDAADEQAGDPDERQGQDRRQHERPDPGRGFPAVDKHGGDIEAHGGPVLGTALAVRDGPSFACPWNIQQMQNHAPRTRPRGQTAPFRVRNGLDVFPIGRYR